MLNGRVAIAKGQNCQIRIRPAELRPISKEVPKRHLELQPPHTLRPSTDQMLSAWVFYAWQ
eukprot:12391699-Karenia_brevis.AAC.1